MKSEVNSKLDKAFEELESVFGENRDIRNEMIAMLRKQIPKCEISEYDKGITMQSKMTVLKTLDDLLKSKESITVQKLKLQMSRTEQESNGQYSQAIVQLLKMVRADGHDSNNQNPPQKEEDIQEQLEKRGAELKVEITEGEIEDSSGTSLTVPQLPDKSKEEPKTEKE